MTRLVEGAAESFGTAVDADPWDLITRMQCHLDMITHLLLLRREEEAKTAG